jgi:hypothetical protein
LFMLFPGTGIPSILMLIYINIAFTPSNVNTCANIHPGWGIQPKNQSLSCEYGFHTSLAEWFRFAGHVIYISRFDRCSLRLPCFFPARNLIQKYVGMLSRSKLRFLHPCFSLNSASQPLFFIHPYFHSGIPWVAPGSIRRVITDEYICFPKLLCPMAIWLAISLPCKFSSPPHFWLPRPPLNPPAHTFSP